MQDGSCRQALEEPHRGTRDLDLLGFGDPSPDAMLLTFQEILTQDRDAGDGVMFDANALRVDRIREELEYGGLRLRTIASISGARIISFDDDRLARAISATFARRETAIPTDRPDALSPAFAADELKQRQWRAFLEDVALDPGTLADVTDDLAAFLVPHASSAADSRSRRQS